MDLQALAALEEAIEPYRRAGFVVTSQTGDYSRCVRWGAIPDPGPARGIVLVQRATCWQWTGYAA